MPIARILFPIALPEPFDYDVPAGMHVEPGSYVRAPLGKTERTGVVWDVVGEEARGGRELKPVLDVYPVPPMTAQMRCFIDWSAKYCVASPGSVLAMVLRARGGLKPGPVETVYVLTGDEPPKMTETRARVIEAASALGPSSAAELSKEAGVSAGVVSGLAKAGALRAEKVAVDAPYNMPDPERPGLVLTGEQDDAAVVLRDAVKTGGFAPWLLDGVTGSGKTEVYFEAIAETLRKDADAQILILLPEIALTQAVLGRFTERFGAAPATWHSGLSEKERRRAWRESAHGRARIVIGARSALFLPFQKLGLIIVDEEHDGSYKQEDGVRYQARDLAVVRAKLEGACVVLASATPALETLVNAEAGRYGRLKLAARPGAARLPDIELIDLTEDPPGQGQWLSPLLQAAMLETLERGEQSLLFMNRRGYAPLVICKGCGERLKSPGTDSWLTEHRYTGRLVCHVTGYSIAKPTHCPHCGAADSLMGVGPGVERVAEEARNLMPEARIEIFSSDTAGGAENVRSIVSRMVDGEIDVLIGTQIVAKGHNFPALTLVGVVDADAGMKGGDLRAGERTYQLLSQVAGRAGRAERPGRALIQTYTPTSPAMAALAQSDRDGFLAIERDNRDMLQLPPFGRMAALILSAPSADAVDTFAKLVAKAAPHGAEVKVFGPAPAPLSVLRGRHRRRFLVQSPRRVDLSAYMAAWRANLKVPANARMAIDIDPYSFL
ncbi:MAG: primosomal protein N' [Hyphomonadaceae bacterium]